MVRWVLGLVGATKGIGREHVLVWVSWFPRKRSLHKIGQVKGSKGILWTSKDKKLITARTPEEAAPSSLGGPASA